MVDEASLREHVYRWTVETGRPPRIDEAAAALALARAEVAAGFRALAGRRLLALAPGSGEIVMAPPFAANPTPFRVVVADRSYFANCVWDAYGVAAALHDDAGVEASCGCCGEPMALAVRDGRPAMPEGIAHFAVPAKHWWDDIAFT